MRKIDVSVITSPKGESTDSREIKIPWVYNDNIGKSFKAGNYMCKFDTDILIRFLLCHAPTVTINSDMVVYYINHKRQNVPSITIPWNWLHWYVNLDGVTLKPNEKFMNNSNWNIAMSIIFDSPYKLRAMWTTYYNVGSDITPLGLSLVQEEYIPEIEYVDDTDNCDSYTATVKWGYSVKDLPMIVSTNGYHVTSGHLCFKDYKEKLMGAVSKYGDTYKCLIKLEHEDDLSIVTIVDKKTEYIRISPFNIKLLDIDDDGITFSILGDIPNGLKSVLSNNDLVALFVWERTPNDDNEYMPIGFQIILFKYWGSEIAYVEKGGLVNE